MVRASSIIAGLCLLMAFAFLGPHQALCTTENTPETRQGENEADPASGHSEGISGSVHKLVAGLSDEQVRRLLIEELQKTGSYSKDEDTQLISKGFFSGMLARLESYTSVLYWRLKALQFNYIKLPYDIAKAIDYLAEGRGIVRFGQMLGFLLLIFGAGFGVEKLIGRFTYGKSKRFGFGSLCFLGYLDF